MEVKGTATICISTPLGSSNFYSELTRVTDERGRPIFNVLQIGHSMRPEWKPIETYSTVSALSQQHPANDHTLTKTQTRRVRPRRSVRSRMGRLSVGLLQTTGQGNLWQQHRAEEARDRRRDHRRRGHCVQEGDARRLVQQAAHGAADVDREQHDLCRARPERRREQVEHAWLEHSDRVVLRHERLLCGRRGSVWGVWGGRERDWFIGARRARRR